MSGLAASALSRSTHRLVHVAFASLLGVYLYAPTDDLAGAETAVQVVVFPALALSGLLLWRGAAVRRRLLSPTGGAGD